MGLLGKFMYHNGTKLENTSVASYTIQRLLHQLYHDVAIAADDFQGHIVLI
jgi:hypothetical protein